MLKKKLYKSDNRIIFGVLGGIAEYFNIDANLVRIIYVLITAFAWFMPGVIAYFLMALVMPTKPTVIFEESKVKEESENKSTEEQK